MLVSEVFLVTKERATRTNLIHLRGATDRQVGSVTFSLVVCV